MIMELKKKRLYMPKKLLYFVLSLSLSEYQTYPGSSIALYPHIEFRRLRIHFIRGPKPLNIGSHLDHSTKEASQTGN